MYNISVNGNHHTITAGRKDSLNLGKDLNGVSELRFQPEDEDLSRAVVCV